MFDENHFETSPKFFGQTKEVHEASPLDPCSLHCKLGFKAYIDYVSIRRECRVQKCDPDPWCIFRGATRKGLGGPKLEIVNQMHA